MTNVRTAVLDLEQIDQPDESYDVVLCREGLMFAVEPDRAPRVRSGACFALAGGRRSPSGDRESKTRGSGNSSMPSRR